MRIGKAVLWGEWEILVKQLDYLIFFNGKHILVLLWNQ